MPLLEVVRLSKTFNGLRVLDGVSLSVERGETFGLIGPNGAGKTTMFNVISGFLRPDGGQVRFHGDDLVGLPPHQICRKGVARTFQLVQPFSDMTVLDNVAAACLFGKQRFASIQNARRRARHLLELIKLEARGVEPAGSLSLSERKRLEIARALATGGELLLLDEVMAGLTPAESQEMGAIIRQMQAELGLTVLIIEHNVRLVTGLSHRMAVLNHGCIIAQGEPAEVVRVPEVIKAYLGERRSREA
jgi:branched-chain amino acid transport system ATP-binding protein